MTRPTPPLAAMLALAAFAASAPAYYHYLHLRNDGGVQTRLVEKFDLNALPDKRVLFFVSRQQLPILAVNDSFDGVLSQVRQALAVWDAVPTSDLRVGFGGVVDGILPGQTPAGQIIFAELPPGVIGMGGPIATLDSGAGFFAIQQSQVVLSNNLVDGSRPRTSFSELFFSTLVHEIGHALGLQHTLASSAMSTDITRSTTRPQPLGADDLAGLSVLYPTAAFKRRTGTVQGRVSFRDGSPAALASVAAIHPSGAVLTALTDPDGRYVLEGLQPGDYLLFVQPLPPASQEGLGPANVVLPVDLLGISLSASSTFRGTFRGGGNSAAGSPRVAVRGGDTISAVDFNVERRTAASVYNVTTYSFPGNNASAVHPAFLDLTTRDGFLVATGQGLTAALPQLQLEAIGRDVQIRAAGPYEADSRFARIDFNQAPFAAPGALHLLFRTPDDLYLLPAAVQLTDQPAPVIHWITPDFSSPDDYWRVGGERFDAASEVYFDGAPGQVLDYDADSQEIIVVPPPGPPGRSAVVTVYNPDGQSSALTLPDGNAVFAYPSGAAPAFELAPAEMAAGSDALIQVRVSGTGLDSSQLDLGFGSSDIVVRDIDVVSPDRLRAVVSVRAGATSGRYPITLSNGLQTVVRRDAFQVVEAPTGLQTGPVVRYQGLVNSATGRPDLSPGTMASLFGTNLSGGDPSSLRVTFNGTSAQLLAVTDSQINLMIPETAPIGAVELVVSGARGASAPMLVRLDRTSPGLFFVFDENFNWTQSLVPGRPATLIATGLGPIGALRSSDETPAPVQIVLAGMRLRPTAIEPSPIAPGAWRVAFETPAAGLPPSFTVTLLVDGRTSNDLTLSAAARLASE